MPVMMLIVQKWVFGAAMGGGAWPFQGTITGLGAARVVDGSSAVNATIALSRRAGRLGQCAALGNDEWGWESLTASGIPAGFSLRNLRDQASPAVTTGEGPGRLAGPQRAGWRAAGASPILLVAAPALRAGWLPLTSPGQLGHRTRTGPARWEHAEKGRRLKGDAHDRVPGRAVQPG
jgi:hypothetical protein